MQVQVQIDIKPGPGTEANLRRLERLVSSDQAFVMQVLMGAVQDTLVKAYQQRFLQAVPRMMDMQKANRAPSFQRKLQIQDEMQRMEKQLKRHKQGSTGYLDTLARMERLGAEFSGSAREAIGGEDAELRYHHDDHIAAEGARTLDGQEIGPEEFGMALQKRRKVGARSPLSTGLFEKRMFNVAAQLSKVEILAQGPGQITLGIGNLQILEGPGYDTPSYTEYGNRPNPHPTTSPFRVLWRQLEFGTGMFTKPAPRTSGYFKDGAAWWLGPQRGQGLKLAGSQPGNILWNAQGLPYDADATAFEGKFAMYLTRALTGI